MEIHVKLYGIIRLNYQPPDFEGDILMILEEDATVRDIIKKMNIGTAEIGLILLNGNIIKRDDLNLKDHDVVSLYSFIFGG